MLILEDQHWGQAESTRLLARLSARALPLLVVATYRNDEQPGLPQHHARGDVGQWLEDCAGAAVLDFADRRWRFAHDKLREGTLASLPRLAAPREPRGLVNVVRARELFQRLETTVELARAEAALSP